MSNYNRTLGKIMFFGLAIVVLIMGYLIISGIADRWNAQGQAVVPNNTTRSLPAYHVIQAADVTNNRSDFIGQYTLVPLGQNEEIKANQVRSLDNYSFEGKSVLAIDTTDPLVMKDRVCAGDRVDLLLTDTNNTSRPMYADVYVLDVVKNQEGNSTKSCLLVVAVNESDVKELLMDCSKGYSVTRKLAPW